MLLRTRARTLAWVFLTPAVMASAAPTIRWCAPETCAPGALPTVACLVALDPSDGGSPIPPQDCPLARAAIARCAEAPGAGCPMHASGCMATCGVRGPHARPHFIGDPSSGRALTSRLPAVPLPTVQAVPVAPVALLAPPVRAVDTPPAHLARPPTRSPGAPPPARAPPTPTIA